VNSITIKIHEGPVPGKLDGRTTELIIRSENNIIFPKNSYSFPMMFHTNQLGSKKYQQQQQQHVTNINNVFANVSNIKTIYVGFPHPSYTEQMVKTKTPLRKRNHN
jgi:hypothetical protein